MGLAERIKKARKKAVLQATLYNIAKRQATVEAISESKDGGLLVHVAIERGQA